MIYRAVAIDEYALDALDAALIDNDWFRDFALPADAKKLKRIVVDDIIYLLSEKADENCGLLIINLNEMQILRPDRRPRYPFERIVRVGLHHFRPEVAIPIHWQTFHSGSLLSIYAENITKKSEERIFFEQEPNGGAGQENIYAFASATGVFEFSKISADYKLYNRAVSKYIDALLSEPAHVPDGGNYGIVLSEPLGAQIGGAISLKEWVDKKITPQQRDFIGRPLDAPVRLKGAAGTGKTQSIAIKVLADLERLEKERVNSRIAVITHSSGLAHDVIRGMMFAMDQRESWSSYKHASLWIGTLYELAQEILQYEKKGLRPLSLDGREGRELQRLMVEDAIASVVKTPEFRLVGAKDLSATLSEMVKSQNKTGLYDVILNEFSAVIDAENIRKGTDEAKRYCSGTRELWQISLTDADREFILDVHEQYTKLLHAQKILSMDQMIADFNRYCLTHEWRQLKESKGFDAVFVDEYHYFNRAESMALHNIFKESAPKDGKLPLFMAYDLKQGPDDIALSAGGRNGSLNFLASKAGRSELVELTEVFRSTPQIAEFLMHLDGAFPAMDLEGQWMPYGAKSNQDNGAKPQLLRYAGDTQLVDDIFSRAERRAAELKEGGRQVAVLCMNEKKFDLYRDAGRIKNKFISVTSRDEMNELKYAKKKCVFSMPEFVAGLQFDTVYLIHVDESDFDLVGDSVGHHRRYISRCYLGASRASKNLLIAVSNERGGESRILAGAISEGSLVLGS